MDSCRPQEIRHSNQSSRFVTVRKKSEFKELEKQESKIGTNTGIWFYARDIMSEYKELKSKEVEITKPVKQVWGGIMCTVYDQDKNSYGLVGDYEE